MIEYTNTRIQYTIYNIHPDGTTAHEGTCSGEGYHGPNHIQIPQRAVGGIQGRHSRYVYTIIGL